MNVKQLQQLFPNLDPIRMDNRDMVSAAMIMDANNHFRLTPGIIKDTLVICTEDAQWEFVDVDDVKSITPTKEEWLIDYGYGEILGAFKYLYSSPKISEILRQIKSKK